MKKISVREISQEDLDPIISYWLDSDHSHLIGMGVDLNKMPDRTQWRHMLSEQLSASYENKNSYCIIWLIDNVAMGHCNVNKIIFGKEAYMHLHIWNASSRNIGLGMEFIKMTLPYFFENLKLKKIFCEPYALNPSPNNLLRKFGFQFVRKQTTIPGYINFEQEVNLWEMTKENFEILLAKSPKETIHR